MAEKNIEMRRKRADGGYDMFYPVTRMENVQGSLPLEKVAGSSKTTPGGTEPNCIAVTAGDGAVGLARGLLGGVPILSGIQVFQASGTFVVPAGVTRLWVEVVGGGGMGANAAMTRVGAGGGGGGGYTAALVEVIPGMNIPVTIGAGGSSSSRNGGTSSFGAYCSATGGKQGGTTGGGGGTGVGGDINISGQGGGGETIPSSGQTVSGAGGGSYYGGGGPGVGKQGNGVAGGSYGGGGSGGARDGTSGTYTGGRGAAGVVIVRW